MLNYYCNEINKNQIIAEGNSSSLAAITPPHLLLRLATMVLISSPRIHSFLTYYGFGLLIDQENGK